MQFTLRRLLLAIPWFGLAALVLGEHLRFAQVAREAAAQGQFVCGMGTLGLLPLVAVTIAGIAALVGERWLVVVAGVPTAAYIVLWFLAQFA